MNIYIIVRFLYGFYFKKKKAKMLFIPFSKEMNLKQALCGVQTSGTKF